MNAITEATDGNLFLNRELSQLEFNFRVLAQAADPSLPLLERLKYLCIACTNLDEFFEVRVATVLTALRVRGAAAARTAWTRRLALEKLHKLAGKLVEEQYRLWNDDLRPALNQAGIRVLSQGKLERQAEALAAQVFQQRGPAGAVAARHSIRCIRSRASSTRA